MTTYIVWPVDIDEAFRTQYQTLTGEKIQGKPRKDGTSRMIGSNNLTAEHVSALSAQFPTLEFYNEWPTGWDDDEFAWAEGVLESVRQFLSGSNQ